MTIEYLNLNDPDRDVQYIDAIMALDERVNQANAAPWLHKQDYGFYWKNLAGATWNVLAVDGERVVGYSALRNMNVWPSYLDPVEYPKSQCAMLLFNLVDPHYRGQGIGKQLGKIRVDWAKSLGFRYLFSTVHPDNTASMRLLTGLGMNKIAQKPMFSTRLLRNLMFVDLQA